MIDITSIRGRYAALSQHLDERARRVFAATEAKTAGYGGIAAVSRATGMAASTIGRGLQELADAEVLDLGRVRRPGGGGKKRVTQDATLVADLLALVEPDARGDPMSPLRWTVKSLSQLTQALVAKGHRVGRTLLSELLHQQKFSLQANRKTREGESHPDRNAQFSHLNESVRAALAAGESVISVDTKKKELVGDFKIAGRAWRPQGQPEDVRVHDFLIKELGRAVPYGIYDLASNAGWAELAKVPASAACWKASVGQRRHERRYVGVRGPDDPPLVAGCRPGSRPPRQGSRCAANSITMSIRRGSSLPTTPWKTSTLPAMRSTGTGTTPSTPPHRQSERLTPDEALGLGN